MRSHITSTWWLESHVQELCTYMNPLLRSKITTELVDFRVIKTKKHLKKLPVSYKTRNCFWLVIQIHFPV